LPTVDFAIASVFALGVGVVDDQHQARLASGGPFKHLPIAIGVAECGNWFSADKFV
jgi:hypothetical protein